MRLANKVAIITGSARGMGRIAAEMFAHEGACVVVTDIAEQEGTELVSKIRTAGGQAIFVRANVSEEEDVKGLVSSTLETFGRIDILYNNAGIMPAEDTTVIETSVETWQKVIDVNLKSVFLCCKHTVPHMITQQSGSIINIASFVVFMGCTVPQEVYGISKSGMLGLTKSLAVQYGRHGVRCNAICPGPIDTGLLDHLWSNPEARDLRINRIPLGRFGRAEDVIYLALYLASDESSWTTGTWLTVDGGISANYF